MWIPWTHVVREQAVRQFWRDDCETSTVREEEWSSEEAARATRASLGGCATFTLITLGALAIVGYLIALAIDLMS